MTPLQQLGRNIRRLRGKAGMTQASIADECGVTNPTVIRWERGESHISAYHLHALACCFGVTMDSFFDGIEWSGDCSDDEWEQAA